MKVHVFVVVLMLELYPIFSADINGNCVSDSDCPTNATCRPNSCQGLNCLCKQGFVKNGDGTGCVPAAMVGESCDANTLCFGYQTNSVCNNGKCECRGQRRDTAFKTCVPIGRKVAGETCAAFECNFLAFCNTVCQCDSGFRNLTEEEFWTYEDPLIDCVSNTIDLNLCSGTPVIASSTTLLQSSPEASISETGTPISSSSVSIAATSSLSACSTSSSVVATSSSASSAVASLSVSVAATSVSPGSSSPLSSSTASSTIDITPSASSTSSSVSIAAAPSLTSSAVASLSVSVAATSISPGSSSPLSYSTASSTIDITPSASSTSSSVSIASAPSSTSSAVASSPISVAATLKTINCLPVIFTYFKYYY